MNTNTTKQAEVAMTEQWEFNEWITELADPFWLKDAHRDGEFFDANGFARALLSASKPAAPDGWKLVPVDLSERMKDEADFAMQQHAGEDYGDFGEFDGWYQPIWSAMLAAAPAVPAQSALALDDERAAFEAWWTRDVPAEHKVSAYALLKRFGSGYSANKRCADMWEAWQARAASPQSTATQTWQPIETAPKDGTPLVLFARYIHASASVIIVGHYMLANGMWINTTFGDAPIQEVVPSHWMRRPDFPPVAPKKREDK